MNSVVLSTDSSLDRLFLAILRPLRPFVLSGKLFDTLNETSGEGREPGKLLLRRGSKDFAGSFQENAETAGLTNPIDAPATG